MKRFFEAIFRFLQCLLCLLLLCDDGCNPSHTDDSAICISQWREPSIEVDPIEIDCRTDFLADERLPNAIDKCGLPVVQIEDRFSQDIPWFHTENVQPLSGR